MSKNTNTVFITYEGVRGVQGSIVEQCGPVLCIRLERTAYSPMPVRVWVDSHAYEVTKNRKRFVSG